MLQIEPHQDTPEAMLPISHKEPMRPVTAEEYDKLPLPDQEPRWDPEKATKRKVRVVKVPYDQDPMKEKTVFEYQGFVYICYAKKTRGRSMIRCLGLAHIDPPKKQTPFESGKLLDNAKGGLENDSFDDAISGDGIKDIIDKDIIDKVIKEAIDDEAVQKAIKEVAGEREKEVEDHAT